MYRDTQEPMLASAVNDTNPFGGVVENNSDPTKPNVPQGQENRDPLPNPWSQGQSDSSTTNTSTRMD